MATSCMTVYSISRLFREWTPNLKGLVSVGGRIEVFDDRHWLTSALERILLPPNIKAKAGSLAIVNFQAEDIQISGSAAELRGESLELKILGSDGSTQFNLRFNANWNVETARGWADFLKATRNAMETMGLREVTTPTLVMNPGMEPELEPFATEIKAGQDAHKVFLTTSPELHLKQLIVAGHTDIYEIKTVFRNEELTDYHQPEFLMLEWYRAFAGLELIEQDLISYIESLKQVGLAQDWSPPIRVSVTELCLEYAGFDLTPSTTAKELITVLKKFEQSVDVNETWNDLFHRIYVGQIEPRLPMQPLIVYDFPPSQAALAKINERGYADRFELYWKGIEICNAFGELTDPGEQQKRFERDQKLRHKYGRTPLEIDENFMNALKCGLPPTGGIAVGLDRLFMVATGNKTLSHCRPFPYRAN